MSETTSRPDGDELTYEQAREELVATVSKLEAGGTALEEGGDGEHGGSPG